MEGRWRPALAIVLLSAIPLLLALVAVSLSQGRPWRAAVLGVLVFVAIGGAGAAFGGEEEAPHDPFYGGDGRRWSMSEDEFEALVREVESNPGPSPSLGDDDFQRALSAAVDELPDWVREELERNVSILVADDGFHPERYGHPDAPYLYGLYHPSETAASWQSGARIIVFRDTLLEDFADPDELRRQIVQTLRHEIAHHFGADERRVEDLGL